MKENTLYNQDAEIATIGSILIDDSKLAGVREVVSEIDFYDDRLKWIFRAMCVMGDNNTPIDLLTLSDFLSEQGYIDIVGGVAFLAELTSSVPSITRALHYAKIVAEYGAKRRIKKVAETIDGATERNTLEETLAIVQDQIHDVNKIGGKQNKYQVSSMLDHVAEAEERYKNRNKIQGLHTGFPSIDRLTMGLVEGELIIVAGPTSKGKGNRVSEIIPTPLGDKRFGDLLVGDEVFGSNGKPTTITGTYPLGKRDIYRVSFSDGAYLDVTEDHIWTLQRTNRPDMIRTTKELIDKLPSKKYHIPTVSAIEYADNTVAVDPYILGLYIADGYSKGSQVYITKNDHKVVEYIYSIDGPDKKVGYNNSAVRHMFLASGNSNFRNYLKQSKLYDKRSKEKFIPNEWFGKSYDIRLRLLRGLMDGDGSYVLSKKQKHGTTLYHSTSEKLIDDIIRLATSIGWIARKGIVKHKKGNYFRLTFLATNFINPFLHSKESTKWCPLDKEVKRNIISIEKNGSEEAMCISVAASDQLYVADTRFHVVTHNTLLSMHIANNVAKEGHRVLFVTLEMTKTELTSRYMYVNGGANTTDFAAVAANTVFQENDELEWKDIDGLIQNAKQELDVDLVVIDHLHYFARDLKNAAEELGQITMRFKKNAIRHKLPIILISHIKKLSKDEDLSLEALRGSSLIGQDADIVLMVNRDPETNQMGVMIDKNRNRGKLSDRTKNWGGQTERELNTIYLDFNNTKLHDPTKSGEYIQQIFPGAQQLKIQE